MRKLNLLIYILAIIGSTSCKNTKDDQVIAPENVSFSKDVQPIFTAKCIVCHGGSKSPDLREGYSYNSLTATSKYINTESPAQSYFYKVISTGKMAKYLNDYDRAIILRWIELGAKND